MSDEAEQPTLEEVVDLLSQEVVNTSETVEKILEFLTDLPAGGPWGWRYLNRDQARVLAEELRDWVDWLIARYRLTNIPPCWFEHGDFVEELTALMVAWKAAYNPKVHLPNDNPIAWHDRWFRPCMERLKAASCVTEHRPTKAAPLATDLVGFVAWLDRLDDQIGPEMSPQEIGQVLSGNSGEHLLDDDSTSPVRDESGRWWSRRRESPQRLMPDWSRRDPFSERRLDMLAAQRPVDEATGEVDMQREQAWARAAGLAARGMGLMREPKEQ